MVKVKDKGAAYERELAAVFRAYGYDEARRTAQYCGKAEEAADVVGLPMIHIEAKRQETMRLYEWMEQAKRDCDGAHIPAVFHRKNRAATLVTMELHDWMQLYKQFEVAVKELDPNWRWKDA